MKIYIYAKKRTARRISVQLDQEDYLRYKCKRICLEREHMLYFREKSKKKSLVRDILNLEHSWQKACVISKNKFDLRKKNLRVYIVPDKNRNRYRVHTNLKAKN